jgi:hypothetical protein
MSAPDLGHAAPGWNRISRRMPVAGQYRWDIGAGIALSMHEGAEHMMTSLQLKCYGIRRRHHRVNADVQSLILWPHEG